MLLCYFSKKDIILLFTLQYSKDCSVLCSGTAFGTLLCQYISVVQMLKYCIVFMFFVLTYVER